MQGMTRAFLFGLSALLHLYLGLRLGRDLPAGHLAFGLALAVSALLMPLGLLAPRWRSRRHADAVAWAGLLTMGLFSSVFVLTLARDALLLAAWPFGGLSVAWVQGSAVAVLAGGLLVTAAGFLNARRTATVVKVDVPIAGLPAALEGFTIAQITDIHVGPTIKSRYVQAIVDRVNGLQPDMVAVTGDLVDGTVPELADHVAPLAQLRSRHGTYVVTGNHEYYAGAHAWIAELRRLRLTVLMNEHVVLQHGADRVVVAGVADWSAHQFDATHRSDPVGALAGSPDDVGARLLLAHQPRTATLAADAGYDLQLSGHTHGGQFFPWNLFVPLQQPFTAGLHRLKRLWVYTSRGTGYWGPPKRFGAPSEITCLRLVTA
jgi:predicted MPP superfamily phosphohydrolase